MAGAASNADNSTSVESMEDNPDEGCHIYRNGYYRSDISVVGKDVSQHLNRRMGLTTIYGRDNIYLGSILSNTQDQQ